jgi:hypothetical protein
MTNLDKVSAALAEWAFNVAKAILPSFKIAPNSKLGNLMGLIGANPATYNIWNELGFLAEPLIQTMVTPLVRSALGGIPDESIPELANKFVDSFIEQARRKGDVDVFGIKLGENAFEGLKQILANRMEE